MERTPGAVVLPIDVAQLIMETLASMGDFRSLRTCSKASTTFREICSKHTFASVTILDPSYLCASKIYPILLIQQLKNMLEVNPTLSACIKELVIMGGVMYSQDLPIILDKLQKIESLVITSRYQHYTIGWKTLSGPLQTSLRRICTRLTNFNLDNIEGFPPLILAVVTSLRTLAMEYVEIDPLVLQSPHDSLESLDVATLECFTCALEISSVGQLEFLRVCMNAFSGLRTLTLNISDNESEDHVPFNLFDYLHPSALNTLQHINLCFTMNEEYDLYHGFCSELQKLASAKCPIVTCAILVLPYVSLDDVEYFLRPALWAPLDEVMTTSNFAYLRQVTLQISPVLERSGPSIGTFGPQLAKVLEGVFGGMSKPLIEFSVNK
ncbi:hypothetical protein BDN70DRAFT_917501 [Pholiota conissans]|uniref:F-box domain-containing protein n=1 Tax=Pholiota conissans TaxID=109636 RepID=A0A9P5ZDJ3_9AGAR|nr:hypothetical protein BDN70DRAFT_917501 [Pholiota conissans]